MSGSNSNFQNMDLGFDSSLRIPDLSRHPLYEEAKYNRNRHLQFPEQFLCNQPCQEG